MSDTQKQDRERTPVDDVRAVRERIAAQHAGDLREHLLESNRVFESLREKLNLKLVPAPPLLKVRDQVG